MPEAPDKNAVLIAGLLNQLADLSGEEAALEAYRREADRFDPALSTAGIALELHGLETGPAGRAEARERLVRLRALFLERGDLPAAEMLAEGLRTIDGAELP